MSPSNAPKGSAAARRPLARRVLRVVALVALGMLVGRWVCAPSGAVPADTASPVAAEEWTCAMHPQVRLPEPGRCPICFMDLVPVREDGEPAGGPRTLALSETAAALADVETARVERRAVVHDVPLVGRVTYDESRVAHITAWVPGRLERLFVDFTGVRVREGDHMVELYSPRLIATQKQLLAARASADDLEESPVDIVRGRAEASAEAA